MSRSLSTYRVADERVNWESRHLWHLLLRPGDDPVITIPDSKRLQAVRVASSECFRDSEGDVLLA